MVLVRIRCTVGQYKVRFDLPLQRLERLLDRLTLVREEAIVETMNGYALPSGLRQKATGAQPRLFVAVASSTEHHPVGGDPRVLSKKPENGATRSDLYVVRMRAEAQQAP